MHEHCRTIQKIENNWDHPLKFSTVGINIIAAPQRHRLLTVIQITRCVENVFTDCAERLGIGNYILETKRSSETLTSRHLVEFKDGTWSSIGLNRLSRREC